MTKPVPILSKCKLCGGKPVHIASPSRPGSDLLYRSVACSACRVKTKAVETGDKAAAIWNEWMGKPTKKAR